MVCHFCYHTNLSEATSIEVCFRHRLMLWFRLIILVARTRPLKALWKAARWCE